MVLTNRFGHKTFAGGGLWQDIKVGGKTKECASTHTSCMGIPIPAMAEHKIQGCNACHIQEGNRGDTMQARVQNAFLLGSQPTLKNGMEETTKGVRRRQLL